MPPGASRADAEILLAHVLGCSRAAIIAGTHAAPSPAAHAAWTELLRRRAAGEPVAYLTGRREFWSLELEVTRDVLVPRPETELLVEWALELSPRARPGIRLLDVGTGSGAIALAFATERRDATVVATDVSESALAVARANARRLGLGTIDFRHGDLFAALGSAAGDDRAFDVVVSNPPYVADGDPHLRDLRFEPTLALTAGADGLAVLRRLAAGAPAHLAPGGALLVEHGAEQGAAVRALLAEAGFVQVETRRDLAGLERATGGRRP